MQRWGGAALAAWVGLLGFAASDGAAVSLLTVSYDPTRELYKELNHGFAEHWQRQTGQAVTIYQSAARAGGWAR